jgi:phospholipase/carboxylesterase
MTLPLAYIAAPPPVGAITRLVLLIHGYGANERDLYDLASFFGKGSMTLSLRAPIPLDGYQSFAWFEIDITAREIRADIPQAHTSLAMLIACIEQASHIYQVRPEQVFLVGFSQGATMAALAALSRPDLIAGAAILSGIYPSPLMETPPDAALLAKRRFLVAHGTQDTVVPIEQGRATHTLFSQLGLTVTYHEYPIGHAISQEELQDLAAWLHPHSS